jgi:ABC-type transport system substrate-binding protein
MQKFLHLRECAAGLFLLSVFWSLFSCKTAEELNETLVFRYNESANITSLDPAFAKTQSNIWACNQIFNGLVQLNNNLEIVSDIAHSWNISENGLEYTFNLRNDVFFHPHTAFGKNQTRVVTAHDFVYSFNRLLDENIASPGRWIMQHVARFDAENDHTFKIQLHQAFPGFLGLLSMKYASVVPSEICEDKSHDFRAMPIGTGPFYVKLWIENTKLVLRKNDKYYEKDPLGNKLPMLESVSIRFLPDKQSGFMEFLQGKIDFISGIDASYKDALLTQKGELKPPYDSKFQMLTSPYLNTEYLGFRPDLNPVLADKRIRQALNYGFDRSQLILYLRNNIGTPAHHGMIPIGLPGGGLAKGFNFDFEKAKSLIQDYEKEKGKVPKLQLQTNPSYADMGEFLQQAWRKIGLTVEVDVNPPSTLRQAISTGKADFFRASWIADYPDAENYLSLFYSKNKAPNGPNYTHFQNKTFDTLYDRAMRTTDIDERIKLYAQMDQLVIDEAYFIPLFYDKAVRFAQKNIQGLETNGLNLLQLKFVHKKK